MLKMSLYKDILSVSTKRGATADGAEVGLAPAEDNDAEDQGKPQQEEEKAYEEYMQKLEDTIRIFEKAPPQLLTS